MEWFKLIGLAWDILDTQMHFFQKINTRKERITECYLGDDQQSLFTLNVNVG